MSQLDDLRAQIDVADEQLLKDLRRRLAIAAEINRLKKAQGRAPLDPQRWAKVIASRTAKARKLGLDRQLVQDLYGRIHQQVLAAASLPAAKDGPLPADALLYLGPEGSYSHILAGRIKRPGQQLVACPSVAAILAELQKHKSAEAVLAVENSTTSALHENIDAIFSGQYQIIGEAYLAIKLALVGLAGARLADIKTVYSHSKALAQCQKLLKKLRAQAVATSSTSAAAARLTDGSAAAIGPARLAQLPGLKILQNDVGDTRHNQTHFLLLRAVSPKPQALSTNHKTYGIGHKANPQKITVLVDLKHQPGSLNQLLSALADLKANLTKIESRPVPDKAWSYRFWLDIDISQTKLANITAVLKANSQACQIIGAYQKGKTYGQK